MPNRFLTPALLSAAINCQVSMITRKSPRDFDFTIEGDSNTYQMTDYEVYFFAKEYLRHNGNPPILTMGLSEDAEIALVYQYLQFAIDPQSKESAQNIISSLLQHSQG